MSSVRGLVSESLYLSNFDRVLQPAIPDDFTTATLLRLNYLLDELRDKIPYTFTYRFTDVNDLLNTNFVQVDNVMYIINRVKFQLERRMLTAYEMESFYEGLRGFPSIYWFDESTQSILIYPLPSQPNYTFLVNGRKALGPVEIQDELPLNMPPFMQSYIVYELAFRNAAATGTPWSPEKERQRQEIKAQLAGKVVMDLRPASNLAISDNESLPFPYLYFVSGGGSS